MKKLVFATLMCVAAMSANAQVLTSETVNNVYEKVSNQSDGDYAYNVEKSGKDITAMYVYKKNYSRKGMMTLKPHMKYEYTYAADGTLTSRVAYNWVDGSWVCASRHDYALENGKYNAEFSRYNHTANCFDQPVEKMVYSLMPGDSVNNVSCYHRSYPTSKYQLVSSANVRNLSVLFAVK